MRALFISPIRPTLSGNGLAMRMGLFARALARIAALKIVVIPVAGEVDPQHPSAVPDALLHTIPVNGRCETHFALLSRLTDPQARLQAFRAYGKPSLSAHLSLPVLNEVARLVESHRPDILHIGRAYLAPCIARATTRTVVTMDLDEDDQNSFLSRAARAEGEGHRLEAGWLRQEGLACDRLIGQYGARLSYAFLANPADRAPLSARHLALPLAVIPNAIDLPRHLPARDDGATLLFVGSLGYPPNVDALLWFAREIAPRLRARGGGSCRLWIAGARPMRSVLDLATRPGVRIFADVADLSALYRRATLALAPLRAGGGARIKLLEAAAHQVASIATPQAASGLEWGTCAGGWIGVGACGFAEACMQALDDSKERGRRAGAGRRHVARHYSRAGLERDAADSFRRAMEGAGRR